MNRQMFNLIRAVKYEEPPCTECKWLEKCSISQVACAMFKNYVEFGKSIGENNPTMKIYKEIYNDVRFRISEVSYS